MLCEGHAPYAQRNALILCSLILELSCQTFWKGTDLYLLMFILCPFGNAGIAW